ncbi:MAG: tRNA (guanosine(37)-N1)-methyltransferase TrmD [Thermomicrobiales bacterium]|nr:tRNA (guanosine(37)-N1)-methyltransferase TrmD [Thermomicrobiales bacterium]
MRVDCFTLFPEMFTGPFDSSILKRGADAGLIEIAIHDIRSWTYDRHHTADDAPYGGGAGMVMMAPPIIEGVEAILGDDLAKARVIITSASGKRFTQAVAQEFAAEERLVIICGHYEGIDARVTELLDAEEYAIGDYVLTGGELAAMVMIDAAARLVPGVIKAESISEESHSGELVEYPHYTRPVDYRGLEVPPILLSGHHAKIAEWRREQALLRTRERRPDLLVEE